MKQMINLNKMLIVCMMTVGYVIQGRAQEKVEASAGADLVSSYIWRGTDRLRRH